MDSIKGAIILRELLGNEPEPKAPAPAVDVPRTAPPIFHWLGVEPEQPFGEA